MLDICMYWSVVFEFQIANYIKEPLKTGITSAEITE